MTLSTHIIVVEPTDPRAVFDHCLGLAATGFGRAPTWDFTPAGEGRGFSEAHYVSTCGQGLPVWVWVLHATDGPLVWRDPDDDDEPAPWWNEHCIRINFDTAYGYRSRNGGGCSDLHAWLVQEVGRWLLDRGITKWVWNNEFTGEWFGPDDPVTALGDPVRGALVEVIRKVTE